MRKSALELKNVTVELGGRRVLDGVDLQLGTGDFALLLGPNGAGKSSLIRAIMGELPLQSGRLQRGRVALIAQDPRQSTFDDLTVRENCRLVSREDCTAYLEQFHPQLLARLDHPVRLLSGGERQALALALCLLNPPELLLLDEHTSALDPVTAKRIMELSVSAVQRYGVTTLMCTHNLEHAELYGTRILAMQQGRIVVDAPSLSREQLLQRCYG